MRTAPDRRRLRAVLILTSTAAIAAAVHGYTLKANKWAQSQVSYYVNAANSDVDEGSAEAAVRAGADAWALQSDAAFRFVYAGRTTGSTVAVNGRNEVFFRNESNGSTIATTYWWANSAGSLVEADIKFYDAGFRFFAGSTGCTSGQFIQDIAVHEFGHALGLGHSSDASATMYPTSSSCQQSWRSLAADDIAGVEKLYPPATLAPPPAAPSSLTATRSALSPASAIALAWTDNASNEERFLVERSADGAVFAQVAQLSANVRTYTSTGLTAGRTYWFRVRASNGGGFSGYTNVASATTASAAAAPPPPSTPSPANGATSVSIDADLSWKGTSGATYTVYFGTTRTPPNYVSGRTSASLALPRLARKTTYYWRVVAVTSAGSTSSGTWQFRTR